MKLSARVDRTLDYRFSWSSWRRFENQITIAGKNYTAYADAVFVDVFINSHVENNKYIMNCFILICSVETLSMHTINTGYHPVYQIEFTHL